MFFESNPVGGAISPKQGVNITEISKLYVINSKRGLFSLIYSQNSGKDSNSEFAVLTHNSGIGEEIKNIKITGDTLILKIDAIYQEGTGSYKVKIFHSTKWTFIESNRMRKYE